MYFSWRVGLTSMLLLLLSRLMGVLRESALAAVWGTSGAADVAVAMLTLPDLVGNLFAAGALSLVLLPWWARQSWPEQAQTQRRVAQVLLLLGVLLLLAVALAPGWVATLLMPGAGPDVQPRLNTGLRWAALALPATLLSTLWYTRLQYQGDALGMYGMNLVQSSIVMLGLGLCAVWAQPGAVVHLLGAALLLALSGRALWLHLRLRRAPGVPQAAGTVQSPRIGAPTASLWCWALLVAGVPLLLPVVARSLVSVKGAGALATYNYAWKLVELPNQLAVQLVAALAFASIARAHAQPAAFQAAVRGALMLAWTLACVGVLLLHRAALPAASLLFGWGRMTPDAVAQVAQWAAWGAWTLPPQALVGVLVTVLATRGRMRWAVPPYLLALVALPLSGLHEPGAVMALFALALAAVALALLLACGRLVWRALAWGQMLVPAVVCALLGGLVPPVSGGAADLFLAIVLALLALVASYAASPVLRSLMPLRIGRGSGVRLRVPDGPAEQPERAHADPQ